MNILNQTRTAIINTDMCIAIQRAENKIIALTPKYSADCPYAITLGQYKSVEMAKSVFNMIIENTKKKIIQEHCIEMPMDEEDEDGSISSN